MNGERRAIVQVRLGPFASRKAVLEPGRVLRVGRTELSDFRVPHDRQMSGLHFQISWDGVRCHLRDLRSDRGTWLCGQRVEEADVGNGAWIRAGDTLFGVYVEREATRSRTVDSPELIACKESALAALGAEQTPLFAMMDAARDIRVLELLRESVEEYQSLYDWPACDELEEVAPYLVRLPKGVGLLERLVNETWGESFGVYLTSERAFEVVRKHLQRLLVVKLQGARDKVFFRFYDPRVMRAFIPDCNARRTAEIFGTSIRELFVEGVQGEVLRFRASRNLTDNNEGEFVPYGRVPGHPDFDGMG